MSKAPLRVPLALKNARGNTRVQHAAQWGVIVTLVVAALAFSWQQNRTDHEVRTESSRTAALEAMLVEACNASNFAELKARGLVAECRLAQAGELPTAIPDSKLPEPTESPSQITANVIPDNTTVPGSVPQGTPDQIAEAVNGYFATHQLPITPAYQKALSRAVARYLTDHPPAPGHTPTPKEVEQVVTAVLLANPPPPGQDGAPGVSVTQASLDGCNVVFTFSNGTTQAVGPVCGPKGDQGEPGAPGPAGPPGPAPTDQQVQQAVAAFCQANGNCQGQTGVVRVIDNCPAADPGNFVTNVNADYDAASQTITLSCEQGGIGLGNGNGKGLRR